jgi:hypothetical protein
MSNSIGIDILAKENLPHNIEKLSAMREIYARAKNIVLWQVILTVPTIIILAFVKLFCEWYFKINIEWFVSTYALILFFIDGLILNNLIKSMKENAAGVQELFDCEVLDIEWNKMLFTEKPENGDIHKYHKLRQERNINDNFPNWYPEPIKEVENNLAKIICQQSNITYDFEVRKTFTKWIIAVSIITFVMLFILTAIYDLSFRTFVTNVITPFLPIFSIAIKWYFEQQNSIKTLKEIKSVIQAIWDNNLETKQIPNNIVIRQIQDRIHLHRKECALVPEIIYNRVKAKQEEQMYFSVNVSVAEYQKARTK